MKQKWNRWRYKLRKYRKEIQQLRCQWTPMLTSTHERLKTEALARQRVIWEAKIK